MKMVRCTFFFLWTATAVVSVCGQEQIFNDPRAYFGGEDNKAYVAWAESSRTVSSYAASMFVPATSDKSIGAAIHWSIVEDDSEGGSIDFAVVVKNAKWVGFGISGVGGMRGSDMMMFESDDPTKLRDVYTLDDRYPIDDECADWELVNSTFLLDDIDQDPLDGFLLVEGSRLLDTGDLQDHKILDDTSTGVPLHRVIAAWGESSFAAYHGENRVRGAVRWYRFGADEEAAFQSAMAQEAQGSVLLTADNYEIPDKITEYKSFCFSWNELQELGVPSDVTQSVIGIEPVIDATLNVHHFTLYVSTDTFNNRDCGRMTVNEMFYIWAPGEPSLALPNHVAYSFGKDSFRSVRLEIHYDNQRRETGIRDNSGVRLYYTSIPRQYEMGMLLLGDSVGKLFGDEIESGLTVHSFLCPSTCTSTLLDQPITIFRDHLHMHIKGVNMRNEVIRNGEVVHVSAIDVFEFDQQGNPPAVQEPYQVLPGDAFRTVCSFDSPEPTRFGSASSNEMCAGLLYYYPKVKTNAPLGFSCAPQTLALGGKCSAYYKGEAVESRDQLRRSFGRSCSDPPLPPYDQCEMMMPCERTNLMQGISFPMHSSGFLGMGPCRRVCVRQFLMPFYERQGYECGYCP